MHVVCNEAGQPYHPDTVTHYWQRLCVAAKVPQIRLHDVRHTCGTLMHLQGQPIAVIAQWLGHADPAFTPRTYVQPNNDALKGAAAALQRVLTTS
jgi:integrase